MEASFWHEIWKNNHIGFHESEANTLFVKYFDHLALPQGARVFLPLCGKTRDIAWLLNKGYQVVGAELSEIATQQLFEALGSTPEISKLDKLTHYHAEGIDLFVGDIFDLTAEILGPVDAVYDRAALVALPPETRPLYTKHLQTITSIAPQLLICFQYDQSLMAGPPFSISDDEVKQHYEETYTLTHLETIEVAGGLKGRTEATENIWLASPNS